MIYIYMYIYIYIYTYMIRSVIFTPILGFLAMKTLLYCWLHSFEINKTSLMRMINNKNNKNFKIKSKNLKNKKFNRILLFNILWRKIVTLQYFLSI